MEGWAESGECFREGKVTWKGTCYEAGQPALHPSNPHGGKREVTLCASTCVPGHVSSCPHAKQANVKGIFRGKNFLQKAIC